MRGGIIESGEVGFKSVQFWLGGSIDGVIRRMMSGMQKFIRLAQVSDVTRLVN